jgi:hypothetical protein
MKKRSAYENPHLGDRNRLGRSVIRALVHMLPARLQVVVYQAILLDRTRHKEPNAVPVGELDVMHQRQVRLLPDREALLRKLPAGGTVAELGVDMGIFSRAILEYNQPKKLYLIDTWSSPAYPDANAAIVAQKFQMEIENAQVEIRRGFSFEQVEKFDDGSLDWVYIDTDHSFGTTMKELTAVAPKIKPGGYICGHDYCVVNWIFGELYGVIQAVHTFCMSEGWELIYLTNESHRILSFAIRKFDDDAPTSS